MNREKELIEFSEENAIELNSLEGADFSSAIDEIIECIIDGYNVETDEEEYDIEALNEEEQFRVLETIYNNLKEDKKMDFAREIMERSQKNSDISNDVYDFFNKETQKWVEKNSQIQDTDNEENTEEEPEEEKEEENENNLDSALLDDSELVDNEEEPEEEKEKEEIEKTAIEKYKEATELLRQQIEEKEKELESLQNPETEAELSEDKDRLNELISRTVFSDTNNTNDKSKELNDKITEFNNEIKSLENEIVKLNEDKEKYIKAKAEISKTAQESKYTRIINTLSEDINTLETELLEINNRINEINIAGLNPDAKELSEKQTEKLQKEAELKHKKDLKEYYEDKEIKEAQISYENDKNNNLEHSYDLMIKEIEEKIKDNTSKIKTIEFNKEQINKELSELNVINQENEMNTVLVSVREFKELYLKEIEKLENSLKEINEKYTNMGTSVPYFVSAMRIEELNINDFIAKAKKDLEEKCGIRVEINLNAPENHILVSNIFSIQKANKNLEGELNKGNPSKGNSDEIKSELEGMKSELEEREKNIALYEEIIKDIKEIENKTREDKEISEEELGNIKEKISKITDESLRNELNKHLENALTKKIENIEKNPKKWQKWLSGAAGLIVGGGIVAFTTIGAAAVTISAIALKIAANKYHKHLKKKEAELAKENVITAIEKPNAKQKAALSKFKEKMKDENFIKNVNWFLNGSILGASVMSVVESMNATNSVTEAQPTNAEPTAEPNIDSVSTESYGDIKVGSGTDGMDLSKGFDQADWSINNVNSEGLNQTIMNDGNTIIEQIRDINGNLYSSIEEARSAGLDLNDLSLKMVNGSNGTARAWINAEDALGALGRVK